MAFGVAAETFVSLLRLGLALCTAKARVHLGEVLWMRGREEEAKKLWRIANGKDPKNESLKGTLLRLQIKL